MTCQQAREESAVSLLMREPPPAHIAAHINRCLACSQEWQELAELSPLLAVTLDDTLPETIPASRALLARLLTEVARRRRNRRIAGFASAAAAVMIAVPTGLFLANEGGLGGSATPTATSAQRQPQSGVISPFATGSATEPSSGAQAVVAISETDAGSQVTVRLSGILAGTKCAMVIVDRSGNRQTVGTWWPVPAKNSGTTHPESVDTQPADIAQVDVMNHTTNELIVSVPVQAA